LRLNAVIQKYKKVSHTSILMYRHIVVYSGLLVITTHGVFMEGTLQDPLKAQSNFLPWRKQ